MQIDISTIIVMIASIAVGFALNRFLDSRRSLRRVQILILYDGAVLNAALCQRSKDGIIRGLDQEIPVGLCHVLTVGSIELYISGIDRVPLADHAAVMAARRSVVLKSLFTGRDFGLLASLGSLGLTVLVLWGVWSGLGTQNAQLTELVQVSGRLEKVLDSPLVCSSLNTLVEPAKEGE
jgi:hypothetical protein